MSQSLVLTSTYTIQSNKVNYAFTVSVPLYAVPTLSSFPPPITSISVADKTAHVVHAQGSGRSLNTSRSRLWMSTYGCSFEPPRLLVLATLLQQGGYQTIQPPRVDKLERSVVSSMLALWGLVPLRDCLLICIALDLVWDGWSYPPKAYSISPEVTNDRLQHAFGRVAAWRHCDVSCWKISTVFVLRPPSILPPATISSLPRLDTAGKLRASVIGGITVLFHFCKSNTYTLARFSLSFLTPPTATTLPLI